MLKISNITKKYGNFIALDDFSLDLPNRGLVALVGENGCGKTTLLNLISTIDYNYSGEISLSGISYKKENYAFLRNKCISYIQQDYKFIGNLSVDDNLRLLCTEEDEIIQWLSEFEIEEKHDAYPETLSGGQRQKASFIRGILKESAVLLVDEPTSSMDKESERIAFQFLRKIAEDKLVVMVSHNMNLIEEYADLIVMMGQGRIVSVTENNRDMDIRLDENTILVADDTKTPFFHEWMKIKNYLFEKKELTLKLFSRDKKQEKFLDYSNQAVDTSLKKFSTANIWRLALSDIRYRIGNNIFNVILSAFFLVLITTSFFLGKVDFLQFERDTFAASGYEFINYSDRAVHSEVLDGDDYFYYADFQQFIKKYGPVATLYKSGFSINFPYEADEVFSSEINGYIFFPDGFKFTLACGTYPSDNQILITDYFADFLISRTDARKYEDILTTGISVSDYLFNVSGIIKTNYRSYLEKMSFDDLKNSPLYEEWLYYQQNWYSQFFVNESLINLEDKNTVSFAVAEYGEYIVDIVYLEKPTTEQFNGIMGVNRKLADLLGIDESVCFEDQVFFKTFYGTFVITELIDDEKSNPTLYLSYNFKEDYLQYNCMNVFDDFMLFSFDQEAFSELSRFQGGHYTPISDRINRIEEVTWLLNEYFVPFTLILLVITLGVSIFLLTKQEEKNKFAIYQFRVIGYSDKQIAIWYLVKYAAMMIFELLGTAILFLGSCILLNQILSKIAGCKIALMRFDIGKLLIAFGIYAIFMFGFVFLYFLRNVRKAPIKLYGER